MLKMKKRVSSVAVAAVSVAVSSAAVSVFAICPSPTRRLNCANSGTLSKTDSRWVSVSSRKWPS